MNRYEEKRQARIERFLALSEKIKSESNNKYSQAGKLASVIPFGQPILVGHHSEGRDRRYRARIERMFDNSFKLQEKAEYYRQKAESAKNNNAISSDDPEAINKLKEKIAMIEKSNELIKQANKAIKKATTKEEKIQAYKICLLSDEKAIKHFDFVSKHGGYWETFRTDTAEIRRCKDRIQRLENIAKAPRQEKEINGVKIVVNPEENRVQMFFDGKPAYEIIQKLKRNGFRWSRFNGCWQAFLKNWNIDRAVEIAKSNESEANK
jgi:hypothetical protein